LKGTSNLASNVNLDLALKGTNYILSFYYANAGVNSVLTLLIAGRIWWMARQNRLELGSQNQFLNNEYKAIISILLESGILYPISLIAHVVVEGNTDKISMPINLTPV
ncbi:hypothetical protein GYMLUDRAFT_101465, partial [Collybiopsis luxurians FD-317 M1]